MPSLSVRVDTDDIKKITKPLAKLLRRTVDLSPVMREAAQYMKRSTENRILRTKKAPNGERWAALSDVTVALKGHSQPLFESGELGRSIRVVDVDRQGFMLASDAPYASYMHRGVRKVKGAFKSKRPQPQIPPRPFMGFSQENVRVISKMIRDYLKA